MTLWSKVSSTVYFPLLISALPPAAGSVDTSLGASACGWGGSAGSSPQETASMEAPANNIRKCFKLMLLSIGSRVGGQARPEKILENSNLGNLCFVSIEEEDAAPPLLSQSSIINLLGNFEPEFASVGLKVVFRELAALGVIAN